MKIQYPVYMQKHVHKKLDAIHETGFYVDIIYK